MQRIDAFSSSLRDLGMSPQTSGQQPSLTGQLGGQQVQVDDAQSILADAAEEISLHHAEKAEVKHTSERKKEGVARMDVMNMEEIESFMDAAQAFEDPEQLVQLAKRMLSAQGDPLAMAQQALSQPAEQFLALQYALGQGQKEGADPEVLQALREALLDLEVAAGPRIRADLNTIAVASGEGAAREDILQFQACYQDVVLGEAALGATLKTLLARFEGQDFAAKLEQLVQALGRDLAAARPSCDAVRLQSLVQDLYQLSVVSTLLERSGELSAELVQRYGGSGFAPAKLMQSLVEVCGEKWVAASRFTKISEQSQARDVAPQIFFLTALKGLMREIPVQVFIDLEQRQSVLTALQDALDTVIDQEDY